MPADKTSHHDAAKQRQLSNGFGQGCLMMTLTGIYAQRQPTAGEPVRL